MLRAAGFEKVAGEFEVSKIETTCTDPVRIESDLISLQSFYFYRYGSERQDSKRLLFHV